jgi:hypothetical protein
VGLRGSDREGATTWRNRKRETTSQLHLEKLIASLADRETGRQGDREDSGDNGGRRNNREGRRTIGEIGQ